MSAVLTRLRQVSIPELKPYNSNPLLQSNLNPFFFFNEVTKAEFLDDTSVDGNNVVSKEEEAILVAKVTLVLENLENHMESEMHHSNVNVTGVCTGPKSWATALFLQAVLGGFGVSYAYISRWDLFGFSFGLLCSLWSIALSNVSIIYYQWGRKSTCNPLDNSQNAAVGITTCVSILFIIGIIILYLWGLVNIISNNLLDGSGCFLEESA